MASSESQHTITFKQAKTVPPLFLAGSFPGSNWKPQEMKASRDEDGDYTFSGTVNVVPGLEYQYNIKSGEQGPWIYDKNQALVIPKPSQSRPEKYYSPGLPLGQAGAIADDRSSTPIRIVAETAAEVADTAEQLDKDSEQQTTSGYTWTKEEPLKMPLFAHESFGAYEFPADDALDHDQVDDAPSPHRPRKESKDYSLDEVDINDPTIESFPSDRSSVMDALRKIRSSVDSQPISIETSSPIAMEHGDDFAISGSLSPKSPASSAIREGRLSHSSYGNKRSTASLTSIAEEDSKPIQTSNLGSKSGKPRTARTSFGEVFELSQTPPSDDDKGMIMKQKKKPGLAVDSDGLLS
uniref:AMP-activated protein kinase glycogen-binding domain-containing protein n=1 Tax=Bionectria ochroleuca TaxID=29856 RepID=A0A8H7NAF3_BIOOC